MSKHDNDHHNPPTTIAELIENLRNPDLVRSYSRLGSGGGPAAMSDTANALEKIAEAPGSDAGLRALLEIARDALANTYEIGRENANPVVKLMTTTADKAIQDLWAAGYVVPALNAPAVAVCNVAAKTCLPVENSKFCGVEDHSELRQGLCIKGEFPAKGGNDD